MTISQIEVQIIAVMVAVACSLPGVFLVLRKMSLISDAISHSILPGIALGFFITHNIHSPILFILAIASGMLTVFVVEFIAKSKMVKEDTAIGLVFPVMFSIGVLLISIKASDVHLDVDSVLLGEIVSAPFDRYFYNDFDLGPKSIWWVGGILIVNFLALFFYYKELKISTFDSTLAYSLGFSPVIIHYALMVSSSITTVVAFNSVGAILVVALMIAPAAIAYLISEKLKTVILLSVIISSASSLLGYWFARYFDASIAGSITVVLGIAFIVSLLFAPKKGLIRKAYLQRQQKKEILMIILLLHLQNHEDEMERKIAHLNEHINWQKTDSQSVIRLALNNNMIEIKGDTIVLTKKGQQFTVEALEYITTNTSGEIESLKNKFFLFRA